MDGCPLQTGESCCRPWSGESTSETLVAVGPMERLLPHWDFFGWIGLVVFLVLVVRLVARLIRALSGLGPNKDLVASYGRWAVITGSTDGIGKGYAMELARKGMDICLISRNENKLINVANEIKSLYPVEVRWIKADFSQTDMYAKIEEELKKLDDIGIMVNNVGCAPEKWEAFCNHDRNYLLSTININMTSCIMMTQITLRHMIPKNRGLIVNVGSMSSLVPLPYGALYSSTKTFLDNFSLCLATELSETKIQVQCLRPGFVRTNLLSGMPALTKFFDKVFPFLLPDVPMFTRSAVSTLNGSVPLYTCGYWSHTLCSVLICPLNYISRQVAANGAKLLMRHFWGAITQPDPAIYNKVEKM